MGFRKEVKNVMIATITVSHNKRPNTGLFLRIKSHSNHETATLFGGKRNECRGAVRSRNSKE